MAKRKKSHSSTELLSYCILFHMLSCTQNKQDYQTSMAHMHIQNNRPETAATQTSQPTSSQHFPLASCSSRAAKRGGCCILKASWNDVGGQIRLRLTPSMRIILIFVLSPTIISTWLLSSRRLVSLSLSVAALWYQIIYRIVDRSFTIESSDSQMDLYPVLLIRPAINKLDGSGSVE